MSALLPTVVVPYNCSFLLYFQSTDARKYEIRNQGVHEDYISRLNTLLHYLIFNGRAKTKLAMLAFLYCGEFVKNSIQCRSHTVESNTFNSVIRLNRSRPFSTDFSPLIQCGNAHLI